MQNRIRMLFAALVLICSSAITNASLLDDDVIAYSIDLMTTSGNSIVANGTFGPRDDLFCIDAQIGGTCPPRPFYEVFTGNNGPVGDLGVDGNDLYAAIEVGEFLDFSQITLVVLDLLFTPGAPELIWGSFTFSDLGWGAEEGKVTSVISAGRSTFTDTSVTISIAEADAIVLEEPDDGLSRFGVFFNAIAAEHVPVPVPSSFLLFGLGLAGLGWSRSKQA